MECSSADSRPASLVEIIEKNSKLTDLQPTADHSKGFIQTSENMYDSLKYNVYRTYSLTWDEFLPLLDKLLGDGDDFSIF